MRVIIVSCWLMLLVALSQAQTPVKPFTQYNTDELVHAFPELAGIRVPAVPAELDQTLRNAGENLNRMLAGLPAISAAEQIHELRFDSGGGVASATENSATSRATRCAMRNRNWMSSAPPRVRAERATSPNASSFLVLSHFEGLLNYLLPDTRDQSDFHYAGHLSTGGHELAVVAFAQHAGSPLSSHLLAGAGGRTARFHGLAWIDAATNIISRLHVELAEHIDKFPFETLAIDVVFAPVAFHGVDGESWVPARATTHARFAGGEVHTVHRFSDYRLSEEGDTPATAAGHTASTIDTSEDAFEALARGIQLEQDHNQPAAIAALRDSARLNPQLALTRFHLAAALNSTGDVAGAEAEIRHAIQLQPDDGPSHNLLAILLFRQGDFRQSAGEFRTSAQLQPKEAVVHFNLGEALEKLGRVQDAIEAYRSASALDPNNTKYTTRLAALERSAGTATIRVDVRQVLVPVFANDRQGHYATGLKPSDFHLFEDGVEQTITSFSSESAGAAQSLPETGRESAAAKPAAPERNAVRRTYVVCIDTLHTSMASLVYARAALEKLFRAERPGDALYVLVAVGTGLEILQNTTRDPALVLQALDEHSFQKQMSQSRHGSNDADLSRFRQSLDEAKGLCDSHDPFCPARKRMLPAEANQIAAQERVYNASFLAQLHSVVEQLSRGNDRRSLLLISGGFELVPGKLARELLLAYFPEFRFEAMGPTPMACNTNSSRWSAWRPKTTSPFTPWMRAACTRPVIFPLPTGVASRQ